MTEDELIVALREGIIDQLERDGEYIRVVQDGVAACVDGGLRFRELAQFILARVQT